MCDRPLSQLKNILNVSEIKRGLATLKQERGKQKQVQGDGKSSEGASKKG